MKGTICLTVFIILFCQLKSQSVESLEFDFPVVGRSMPNFTLDDVQNYPKSQVKLDDFRGKWLVLDWWTQICAACVESFPKIDAIKKQFSNKVQIISMAYTGSLLAGNKIISGNNAVRKIFNSAKKVYDLSYAVAFDSVLYQRYGLGTTPYIVIIDPQGTVKAITDNITAQDLQQLMNGEKVQLRKAFRLNEEKTAKNLNDDLPFLTYNNGGPDTSFLFRSLFANWNQSISQVVPVSIGHPSVLSRGKFEAIGVPLYYLYQYAYFGKSGWGFDDSLYGNYYPFPILELKDSSDFVPDYLTGKAVYCYSLKVPSSRANKAYLMDILKKDLQSYFDYNASVEYRDMPYWKLVATNEAKKKLPTKSDTLAWEFSSAGFSVKKATIEAAIISTLAGRFQKEPPFIDETGITDKIDLKIDAFLSDFNDFKRALNKNGLDLVKGEKKMYVLVIRN